MALTSLSLPLPAWVRRHRVLTFGAALCIALAGAGAAIFAACTRDEAPRKGFALNGPVPESDAGFSSALYQTVGVRMQPGHAVKLLTNGSVFDALDASIRGARSSVHIVMYIWEKGAASERVVAALVDRARAGIDCRIVIDDFGSPDFDDDVRPALEAAGCEVRTFRPVLEGDDELARNHRKIVVIDGNVAFVGGFGVRDDWLGDGVTGDAWRDTSLQLTGPAVLDAQQAIAENWLEAGGKYLPAESFPPPAPVGGASAAVVTSTASPTSSRAERLILLMVQAATRRLWIANAYFAPSAAIRDAIERKAKQGVDVRLIVPSIAKNDSKASAGVEPLEVGSLVDAGVRVLSYQPSMMHAKTMVIDDDLAVVSSINLDPLSLSKLEEVAVIVRDRAFTTELSRAFDADAARCERK